MKLNSAYEYRMYIQTNLPSKSFGLFKLPAWSDGKYIGEKWRFNWHLWPFLFDEYHGLLSVKSWMKQKGSFHISGTWRDFVTENADWLVWKLTRKTYKWRNLLLGNFIEENAGKLLNFNRCFASIRSRDENQIYCEIRFNRFNFTVTKSFLVDKRTGKHHNYFTAAFTVEEDEADNFEYVQDVILVGVCRTEEDAQKAIDKISELVPEVEWRDWLMSDKDSE